MTIPETDRRSAEQRAQDERIAAEPPLEPLALPTDALSSPIEKHVTPQRRRPVAVAGVVENGLVRPLDPSVKLPEHSQVIIIASETP